MTLWLDTSHQFTMDLSVSDNTRLSDLLEKKNNQPCLVETQRLKCNIIRTLEMAKQGSHWHRSYASALPYSDNFHRLFLQHKIIRVNEDVRHFIADRTCPLLLRTMLGYLWFWCSHKILNRSSHLFNFHPYCSAFKWCCFYLFCYTINSTIHSIQLKTLEVIKHYKQTRELVVQ